MKQRLTVFLFICFGLSAYHKSYGQADELAQLALDIEKLAQFKQILADLKSGYQILFGGYNTIKNISKGNFELHKVFLDGLLEVNPAVKSYKHVGDIITYQQDILKEYKAAYGRFKTGGLFNAKEIGYMGTVYTNLFNFSLKNLEDLLTVITSSKLRMSDDERLTAIDKIYNDMQDKLVFLRSFNNSNTVLSVQRMKEKDDLQSLQKIYGVK
ncbi:MAG: TerB family tellurite resistance protein [Chitinophagaceae bacterium]